MYTFINKKIKGLFFELSLPSITKKAQIKRSSLDCIAARESLKAQNPILNGQWKCNDPAKTGRAECEAACKNDWHDGDWHRMKFSIKCKDGLKTRMQFDGPPSCTPRERGQQCWQEEWATIKVKQINFHFF